MSQIKVTNLTFGYEGSYDTIFENVSFQLDTDWKLGFIGRNGRGKTTFLNLLLNKYEYTGSITATVDFDYFPFDVGDKSQNTIDVVEMVCNDYEFWRLERELSLLEVSEEVLYRPFGSLSNGEQTKVLLAALFLKENNFLLIDEPTNHLDMGAREILSDYLRSKKGFILVSHDRRFLDNCIDHVLSINRTNIEIQSGNFSTWWANKQNQDSFELASNKRLERDIDKLSAAAKRTATWSDKVEKSKFGGPVPDRGFIGHKAAKMMKRSKSIEARRQDAIDDKSKLLKNLETASSLAISPVKYFKNRLAELLDVSIFYGEKEVCSGLSLTIHQGDRVALMGRNGSGKSSVIKLLLGEGAARPAGGAKDVGASSGEGVSHTGSVVLSHTGNVNIGSGLVISYVSQDTSHLRGNLKDYAQANGIDESLFKAILRKLDFSRVQFEKDMKDFSGGQKKKALIAKSLCEKAHLYIWDEPLNFIDVVSRMQIEELILEHQPTMLFVEHDREFVEAVATERVGI